MNQAASMRNYIVYRHQLFKPSEGFIFDQTRYLKKYNPIFAGRSIHGNSPSDLIIKTIYPSGGYVNLIRHALLRDNRLIAKECSIYQPAFIHAHFGVEGVYALSLAKQLKIPLVTTFHGFDASCSRKGLLFSRKIAWLHYLASRHRLAKKGDRFICVSHFIRDRLLRLGFPEERLITHYIGVDTARYHPTPKTRTSKIILHVARLVEKKGTVYLIKAFSRLQKKGLDAQLIIIGDGPLASALKSLTDSLNINKFVQFLGVQPPDQVIQWMQKSTIFCLPSLEARSGDSEALGIVLLEASACKIPIVATQHGGIPEVVKEGETGFLVPEKNVELLATRLQQLLENESLCEKMGIAGRHFVENNFDLKKQTEKLEEIYASLG